MSEYCPLIHLSVNHKVEYKHKSALRQTAAAVSTDVHVRALELKG